MDRTTSSTEISAACHVLSARAEVAAFHADVERGAGATALQVTVLLKSLADIGVVVPLTLAELSEHLGAEAATDVAALEDPEALARAFTTQIAQHYLDQAATAVTEAQRCIESALAALSSVDQTP